jgi:hypothetical protein
MRVVENKSNLLLQYWTTSISWQMQMAHGGVKQRTDQDGGPSRADQGPMK